MNRIGYKGIEMILHSVVNAPKLEKLYINNNEVNVQAADALYDFISKTKSLKELRISNITLEDVAGLRIAEGLMDNDQVRVVHMASNKLSSEVAEKFSEVIMKNQNLKDF